MEPGINYVGEDRGSVVNLPSPEFRDLLSLRCSSSDPTEEVVD